MKEKSEGLFTPEALQRYVIANEEADFENALQNGEIPTDGLITVKSSRSDMKTGKDKGSHKSVKRSKDRHDKSSKRRRT